MRKDIAKFAIPQALYAPFLEDTKTLKLCDPECWADNYGDENSLVNLTVCGWTYVNSGDPFSTKDEPGSWHCGVKGKLFGPQWSKGELKIWIVNETEYPGIGEDVGTIIADDENSIVQFKQDCSQLFAPIENQFAIEQDYIVACVDG